MLKETPEAPDRKIKSDEILASASSSEKNDNEQIEGEPQVCQTPSESN